MMPATSSTSWWSVLLGGFSTPVTTAQAGADTAEGWATFARALAGEPTALFGTNTFGLTAPASQSSTTPTGDLPTDGSDDTDDTTTPALNWLGGLESTRVVVDVPVPVEATGTDADASPIPAVQDPATRTTEPSDEVLTSAPTHPETTAPTTDDRTGEPTIATPSGSPVRATPVSRAPEPSAAVQTPKDTSVVTPTTAAPLASEAPVGSVHPIDAGASRPTPQVPDAEPVVATGSATSDHEIERATRPDQSSANPPIRPEIDRGIQSRPAATLAPRTAPDPRPAAPFEPVAESDPASDVDLLDLIDDPTPATTRESAASVPTAATTVAMGEALSRVRLSVDRVDRTVSRERAATMERATEFGARLSVRPAASFFDAPTDESATTVPAVETLTSDDLASDTGSAIPTPTVSAATGAEGEAGRERATGLGEAVHATDLRATTGAESVRTPEASFDARAVADLGARLRAAIIETMEQQARDELLNSTREAWTATVTVEPASLGRVDLSVTRGTGGLEVILVAAHQEAARALDAEMDDMVEELARRDLEPAKITVRSGDGHTESDRQPNRSQQQEDARGRRQNPDSTSDETNEREGRRGSARDQRERQAMAR